MSEKLERYNAHGDIRPASNGELVFHSEAQEQIQALEQRIKEGEPEPLSDRVERLEAELVTAQAEVERKRQEDGP